MARARASLEREDRPALLPVSRSEDFTINKSLLNAAISVRNEAGDVHITLGDVADLGSETPNGMFARLRVSAPGPFVVSIAPAVEGQMRTNPGIAGWDVNGDGPVYLGFSTALADEAVFEIFRWSENFWNVVGPCRAAAGDENGISSVTGAGHIIQEDGADLTAQPNLNFGSGLTASNDSENEATLVEIAPGVGLGDMLSATYDPTGVEDDAFAMDSMIEGSDAKIMTAAERSSIASALQPGSFDLSDLGNVSDDTADAGNLLVGGGATFASKAITGAVTINSSGSTSLTDDSATNAKLANMAQATFKGRADGAGTGDPVDLTATQALTIIKTVDGTGSGLDADTVDTIEGASILQKTQLAASTITPGTGTLDLTGTNGQVLKVDGSGNVAFDDEGSVPTELGDLSDVGDGTPTSGYILAADGDSWESVPVSGDLTLVASGAATIANNSVTNAKAQDMAQSTIKGRASGAGTGDPTDLTATQARTILNVEDGADVTDATNVAAAGALMAATYDPNTVADDAFDMDNMVEGSDTKILTAAERTLIAAALQPADIGTAAAEDVGTAVGDVVQLEDIGGGSAGLPAVDGSQLTGIVSPGVAFYTDTAVSGTTDTPSSGTWRRYSNAGTVTVTLDDTLLDGEDFVAQKGSGAGTINFSPGDGYTVNGGAGPIVLAGLGSVRRNGTDFELSGEFIFSKLWWGNLNFQDYQVSRGKFLDSSEVAQSVSSSSNAATIDLESGNVVYLTLTENITTLTLSNPPATGFKGSIDLEITQGSGPYAITWPASVDFAGGSSPTLSAGDGDVDNFILKTRVGGTTWLLFVAGQDMS